MDAQKFVEGDDGDECYYPSEGYERDPCDDDDSGVKEAPLCSRRCQGGPPPRIPQCGPCAPAKPARGGGGMLVALGQQLMDAEKQEFDGPVQVAATIPPAVGVRDPRMQPQRRVAPPRAVAPTKPAAQKVGRDTVSTTLAVQFETTYNDVVAAKRGELGVTNHEWRISDANVITIFGQPALILERIQYCGHTDDCPLPLVMKIFPDSLGLNNIVDEYGTRFALALEPGANIVLTPKDYVDLFVQESELKPGVAKFAGTSLESLIGEDGVEKSQVTGLWNVKRYVRNDDGTTSGPRLGEIIASNVSSIGADTSNPAFFSVTDENMVRLQSLITEEVMKPVARAVIDVSKLRFVLEPRMPPDVVSTRVDLSTYWEQALLDQSQAGLKSRITAGIKIVGKPVPTTQT